MGQERFDTFKEFLNLLDGLGARETAIEEAHSRMLGLVQSARAMTVLSWAPATLVKQLSAVLNGTVSGVSGARLLTQMVQDKGARMRGDIRVQQHFEELPPYVQSRPCMPTEGSTDTLPCHQGFLCNWHIVCLKDCHH